ncbi:cellulase family glycosylhydrolase [Rhizobacter sp. AJA081-3]|uniref:cellulase family glycosylhydrolase n=1 Tax=Rhizobacter sp. AJA081-3 TaxID=2753607 RepID=UPI001ADF5216|nr:cellulase family glycosylhydrolase [Rhizobacter sp. AJA081-3]QTN21119.1 cellulase family glycosylhydrolase [Rhizobacter sp. AJA081-3]
MSRLFLDRARRILAAVLLGTAGTGTLAAGYSAQGGKILDPAGQELQLRGISHYGFNALILQPQFLWAMGWKEQIAQMKSLGFNAIRVPFVPDTLYNTTPVNQLSYIDAGKNPELIGKTPLQALDLWMAEADRQGMYVMLDYHSVSMQRQYPHWFVSNPADFGLIYNKQAYTKENWMRDLAFVARRYAGLPHFFAVDIYNEPNGIVRWSTGDPNATNPIYHWKAAAEAGAAAVLAANPNLMIFVQGINGNFDGREKSNIAMNWGEDFQPQAYQPLAIPADKLVLSPHTYGPDVYVKSSFGAANFPANLAADWDTLFGQFSAKHPVVPGEWGGKYGNGTGGQADVTWQNAFVDYLVGKGMRSSFFWCYTPNSGDTGGILDDQLNVRQDKLALLKKLWGGTATTTAPGATPAPAPAPAPTPAPAAANTQPAIASFSPNAGAIGSVVTITGSGFNGLTQAWVGNAKNASFTVLSDAQVQVTVPAGATTGAIGLINPLHSAFTAKSFKVNGSNNKATAPEVPTAVADATASDPAAAADTGGGAFDPFYGVSLLAAVALLGWRRQPRDTTRRPSAMPGRSIQR